jgi:hypothetical protein
MPEFFDNIYWLLLLIPAIYLGIPLMMRFQQKMQAHPALEELDFDRLSPSISQFLMNQTKALYALGFDEPSLVQLPKPVTNVTTYLVMLVNRNAGDKAMVTAVLGHGPAPLKPCQVEFSTRFDTGIACGWHAHYHSDGCQSASTEAGWRTDQAWFPPGMRSECPQPMPFSALGGVL